MTTAVLDREVQQAQAALSIPKLTHAEAGRLATTEAERVLTLIESLAGADWAQPTDCTEWTVRDMVAHLAGATAAWSSWAEFRRQNIGNPYMKEATMSIDAINRRQLEDRQPATSADLVAEFREMAPRAVRTRQRLPWLLRNLWLPFGPPLGFAPLSYLTDTIYTRDQWMHRVDITRATGREMVVTPEHYGRMVALVVRDLGQRLKGQLQGRLHLLLRGEAGGRFSFDGGAGPEAVIEMEVVTFNRLASGRLAAEQALAETQVTGEQSVARWFVQRCDVPY